MLLRVLLFLLCATGTAAQSAVCAAVGDTCSVKLKALDTATATANAFTFCPFLKTIYHDTTAHGRRTIRMAAAAAVDVVVIIIVIHRSNTAETARQTREPFLPTLPVAKPP